MKNSFMIIAFCFAFLTSFGQKANDFMLTDEYYVTEIDSVLINDYYNNRLTKPQPTSVYLKNRKGEKLFEYKINLIDLEFYNGVIVETLDLSTMKSLKSVIHVEFVYDACCTNYYSTYFLLTNFGELIELPEIKNFQCDGPEPIVEYRFSNQKFGEEDRILLTKSKYNNNFIESIEILNRYAWNGKKIIKQKNL